MFIMVDVVAAIVGVGVAKALVSNRSQLGVALDRRIDIFATVASSGKQR